MVSDKALIFHVYFLWGKTISVVPKSRSSVKVRYEHFRLFPQCFQKTSFEGRLKLGLYSKELNIELFGVLDAVL